VQAGRDRVRIDDGACLFLVRPIVRALLSEPLIAHGPELTVLDASAPRNDEGDRESARDGCADEDQDQL
jgi:hypothetical protein